MNSLGLANFITRNPHILLRRSVLLELCTVTEHTPLGDDHVLTPTQEQDTYTTQPLPYPDDDAFVPIVVSSDGIVYGYSTDHGVSTLYKIHNRPDEPIMDIYDEFYLSKGMIANFNEDTPILTTYGRYILNYYIYACPTGDIFPYKNDLFSYQPIQKAIAKKILYGDITAEQYNKFMNYIYSIGSFAEICVPDATVKSLTTGDEVLAKRDELFAKYKDQLNDPVVISKIEDILISMDREYLSDDPASRWILKSSEYDTSRKKMFITSGVVEAFSKDSSKYVFIPEALNEQLNPKTFPIMCNEIRRGSYMRGKETAKGGESTALVLRLFQNVAITEQNCGYNGEGVDVNLSMKDMDEYLGRYVIDGGTAIELTADNFSSYIDKPIKLRSPKYCKAKDGFCYTCFGKRYELLGVKAVGMNGVNVTSKVMYTAMKAMHITKISTVRISDLDEFII